MDKHKTIIFVGRSGCGKGTQVKLLREKLAENGTENILAETGKVLRGLMDGEGIVAQKVKEAIDQGHLVPDVIANWVMTGFMVDMYNDVKDVIIVDGVQRSVVQLYNFEKLMQFLGRTHFTVINMNVSEEWAMARLLDRGRHDDSEQKIKNRLAFYNNSITPMIEVMRNSEYYTIIDINGEKSIEEVQAEIIKRLGL